MLNQADRELLQGAVKQLASVCDGAHARDGAGFNGSDAAWGKDLASIPTREWTERDYSDASERCLKYKNQLGYEVPYFRTDKQQTRIPERKKRIVETDGTSLIVRFPYDAALVSAVRDIPARWFDAGVKAWRFPFTQHAAIMEFAGRNGFEVTDDAINSAIAVADAGKKEQEDLPHEPREAFVDGDKICIRFPYNRSILESVKQLTGRVFAKTPSPMWKAPITITNLQMVEDICSTYGLRLDQTLSDVIKEKREQAEENLTRSSALDGDLEVEGLALSLMPFQKAGVQYLTKVPKAILADKMGLGKTPQAIATATATGSFPAVVICPAHLKLNWVREINKWTPGKRIYVLTGIANEELPEADWYIANYDLLIAQIVYEPDLEKKDKLNKKADLLEVKLEELRNSKISEDLNEEARFVAEQKKEVKEIKLLEDIRQLRRDAEKARKPVIDTKTKRKVRVPARTADILKIAYKLLVLDEGHYAKNKKAERSKAVAELCANTERVLWMTGTPVENRPSELINALQCLGHLQSLGGWRHFVTRYCGGVQTRFGWEMKGATNLEELATNLRATCFVQRTKEEVLPELPAKQRSVVPLEIDNRREYAKAETQLLEYVAQRAKEDKDFLESLKDMDPDEAEEAKYIRAEEARVSAERAEHLVLLGNLKRIAANGKLTAGIDWMSNFLDSREKIIVFAHHMEVQQKVFDAMSKHGEDNAYRVVRLDPSDTPEDQQAKVDQFQNDPDTLVIVASLSAHAEGWTGTAAKNVVFLEMRYSPGKHDQAEDRCYGRLNDPHGANAWYFVAHGTVDEDSWQMLEEKRAIADGATSKSGVAAMLRSIKKRRKSA